MATQIINKLVLEGELRGIQNLFFHYLGIDFESFYRNEEGLIVFCRLTDDEEVHGFYNPETNMFKIEGEEGEIEGLPDGFKIMSSPTTTQFPDFEIAKPIPSGLLENETDEERKIQWCLENWGVEENVEDFIRLTHNTFIFISLGNGVPKVIEAMSHEFPDLIFHYSHADIENLGTCCGKYCFVDGIIEENLMEDNSDDANRLYIELMVLLNSFND